MEATEITSAPYGHACFACARAKCKCIPRRGGGCERCRRLNKECRPSNRIRRMKKAVSRESQLEQKMDGLMSLLKSSGQPLPQPSTELNISQTEMKEEEYLTSFRTRTLPSLPFVHIPATTSAADVKKDSPFLWKCIAAVQCKDSAHQAAQIISIRETAGRMLLVECQKSLDLLQGLLAYLAWATYQSQPQISSFCMYTQLSIALVFELGLHHPPPWNASMAVSNCNAVGHLPHLRPSVFTVRTMDQRRAVLSCFVLSSLIAQFIGRMDPLRWTSHMTECLNILNESKETPNDAVLVQLTRARLVAEKIRQGPWNDSVHDHGIDGPRAPSSFYIQAIQSQLRDMKAQIPSHLQENTPIKFHLLHNEISLYETALTKPPTDDITQLDHLYACLNAVNQFFTLSATLSPSLIPSLSLTHLIQMSHAFVTLCRLSTFDFPGWDRAAVRSTVDIFSITEKVASGLEQVAGAVGITSEEAGRDAFGRLAATLRRLKDGWAAKIGETLDPDLPVQMDHWTVDDFLVWSDNMWFTNEL